MEVSPAICLGLSFLIERPAAIRKPPFSIICHYHTILYYIVCMVVQLTLLSSVNFRFPPAATRLFAFGSASIRTPRGRGTARRGLRLHTKVRSSQGAELDDSPFLLHYYYDVPPTTNVTYVALPL